MSEDKCKETLCWNCKRACGANKCTWAECFRPVAGWDAEKTELGYLVKSCPQYIEDDEIEVTTSTKEIAKIIGVNLRTFFRWLEKKRNAIKFINEKYLLKKNYYLVSEKSKDNRIRHTYTLIRKNI